MVAKTDKDRRREAKTVRKEASAARKTEKVKEAESKRKVREANGGMGIKILVFDREPTVTKRSRGKWKRK